MVELSRDDMTRGVPGAGTLTRAKRAERAENEVKKVLLEITTIHIRHHM